MERLLVSNSRNTFQPPPRINSYRSRIPPPVGLERFILSRFRPAVDLASTSAASWVFVRTLGALVVHLLASVCRCYQYSERLTRVANSGLLSLGLII